MRQSDFWCGDRYARGLLPTLPTWPAGMKQLPCGSSRDPGSIIGSIVLISTHSITISIIHMLANNVCVSYYCIGSYWKNRIQNTQKKKFENLKFCQSSLANY